jgi:hypothetical protein
MKYLFLVTILITNIFCGTFYISTTGSSSNTCTSSGSPCSTYSSAYSKGGSGRYVFYWVYFYTCFSNVNNTFIFAAGTYTDYNNYDYGNSSTYFIGALSGALPATLLNFTVSAYGYFHLINGSLCEITNMNITYTNSFIYSNTTIGSAVLNMYSCFVYRLGNGIYLFILLIVCLL